MDASRDPSYIADELRDRLTVCREYGDYFMALCPSHLNTNPKSPALSVQIHADGVGVKCHGNPPCSTDAILAPIGMTRADLRVRAELVDDGAVVHEAPARRNGHGRKRERRPGRIRKGDVAYEYQDANGRTIFRVVRTPDKRFFQHTLDAEGNWWVGLDVDPVLYRLPELLAADPKQPVFVVEGEKDADRLRREGLVATTSPMGAGKWKPEYAEFVKGRAVYVIPDNDAAGREHAEQVAASVPGAKTVQLPGLPQKGDASEWFDAGHTPEELLSIEGKEPERPRKRFARVDLATAIESPPQRPRMIVKDMVYAGRVHGLYSAGGMGKSWVALWTIKQAIDQGKNVILIDLENGLRIVADRLREMSVDPELIRRHLIYVPFPSMPLSADAIAEFVTLLEEIEPDLVVIDSWISCLVAAGLSENDAVDIARWAEAYPQQARKRGVAVLILDHVPKQGGSARGSGRKLDYVDVMWELRNPLKFDRETVGRISLHLRKDREGWLPKALRLRIGGSPDGFVIEPFRDIFPSADEATGLLRSDEIVLDALGSFGERGATDKEWREETERRGPKRSTYYKSKEVLIRLALVEKVMNKFFCRSPANGGSIEVHSESSETE